MVNKYTDIDHLMVEAGIDVGKEHPLVLVALAKKAKKTADIAIQKARRNKHANRIARTHQRRTVNQNI